MVRDRPIFTMEHFNRKSWVADQSMSVPAISSDLERCDVMGQHFLADHNYAPTVWPRMAEFGMVTQVGRSIFLGVNHVPMFLVGRAQSSPKFLGPPTYAEMVWLERVRRRLQISRLTYLLTWAMKLGMVRRGARTCFRGTWRLIPRGGALSSPKKIWDRLPAPKRFDLGWQNLIC